MKHIQKFESYSNEKPEVNKVNEEFDFMSLTDVYNGFTQWLQQSHFDGTGELVANWEIVAGVLGALALNIPFVSAYRKYKKEQKDELNKKIAQKVQENPDADPKAIAKEVTNDMQKQASSGTRYRVGGGAPL